MVSRGLFSIGLVIVCLLTASSGIAATLTVTAEKAQLEMGRSLRVLIDYRGPREPDTVDLTAWQTAFHVERVDREVEQPMPGEVHVIETLRLSPRLPGEQRLAALALGGAISRPVAIRVAPAIRNGIDAQPMWLPLPSTVWVGQAFTIGMRVALFDERNEVLAETPDLPGFEVSGARTTRLPDAAGHSVVELRWQVLSQRAGRVVLTLPRIDQRGHGRWRFFLPARQLVVQPLPAYLPPTVPVGPLRIDAGIADVGGRPSWTVRIDAAGRLPPAIHGLARQLAAHADTTVDAVHVDRGLYRVALPDTLWGWGAGLPLHIPVFDAEAGYLVEQQLLLPRQWRLSTGLRVLLGLVGLLLGVTLLMWLLDRLRIYRGRRRLRARLRQCRDAHELRRVLLDSVEQKTLQAWARTAAQRRLADDLNRACFQRHTDAGHGSLLRAALASLQAA